MKKNSILFLALRTYSATGGIEKLCRILGKALYENSISQNTRFEICSMYDEQNDADENPYFPSEIFRGYGISKMKFFKEMVQKGRRFDTVILSHINLLPIGWMIKKIAPQTKLILLAHGIEIWYPIPARKRNMLAACDKIFAVSRYTADTIARTHGLSQKKIEVLNNCLDPFLEKPTQHRKDSNLMKKYGFNADDKILMTLTRISSKERYKGYENVIAAMAELNTENKKIKYLIAGSYDETEKKFLDTQILQAGLSGRVLMPGYIEDADLEAHFGLADLYVMPSRKEGFGIVFIEAMHYGLPVIAGNQDGSVDALLHGELGSLVNPENIIELGEAIEKMLNRSNHYLPKRELLENNFSYAVYKKNLLQLLQSKSEFN